MNELHENNLDRSLDLAKKETNQQIQKVLLQNPFNVRILTLNRHRFDTMSQSKKCFVIMNV